MCEELLNRGHTVRAMVHYNTDNIDRLKDKLEIRKGDVRFIDECYEATKNCDAVIHLAACINVDRSRFHPRLFYETNVGGTMNILEASRKYDCKTILMSTCEILGNIPLGKANEDYPFKQPRSPYASSKYAAEAYCFAYHQTYGLQVNIARGFNLCGPRQKVGYKGALIPIFVHKFLNNESPVIFGDGKQSRDYTDVRDNVKGLANIIESKYKCELFHVCSAKETSITEIALMIKELTNSNKEILYGKSRPGEIQRSVGDNTKIKKYLGWEPEISLQKTIQDVIRFQKSNGST